MAMTLAPDAASTIADSPLTGDTRTVLAATTTPLMMVTEPGGAINGEIMTTQPVVRMTDAAGHTVTSFTGNVMAWAHTGHTVSNTRTVAAVAGVATFTDLAITGRAEPLTLRFTTDSGVAVHSAPFPLAIGRAAKAMIATQPSGAVSGTVLTTQPVVRITDHGGNTVTTYTGNVSITAETGPGNFSGTKTVAAVNGVASFTDLALTANTQFQLTTNNLFTVTFRAGTWPPVTSNLIALTLLPAPAPPCSTASQYASYTTDGTTGTVATERNVFAGTYTSQRSVGGPFTSATLGASTPWGSVYGSSAGKQYISPNSPTTSGSSSTSFVFSPAASPANQFGFALGDVDAESITISAIGTDGVPLTAAELGYQSSFNYAAGADVPTWNAGTSTLVGNKVDTSGATGWFQPTRPIASLTLTSTTLSGSPQYQVWMAGFTTCP